MIPPNAPDRFHSLQEAVDRIEVHCRILTAQGVPEANTAILKALAAYYTTHLTQLERLRSQLSGERP